MTTIRIYGNKLDEVDYFIDANIDSIDLDGQVTLRDENGDRTWQTSLEDIREYREQNYAAEHTNLIDPTHQIWDHLEQLYQYRNDDVMESIANAIETDAESLFQTIVGANTNA